MLLFVFTLISTKIDRSEMLDVVDFNLFIQMGKVFILFHPINFSQLSLASSGFLGPEDKKATPHSHVALNLSLNPH